jgi:hypothetical protein
MSGGFEMIRLDTGERTRIDMDGTEIRDSVAIPTVEYCDKCNNTKDVLGGEYQTWNGLKVLWLCAVCK